MSKLLPPTLWSCAGALMLAFAVPARAAAAEPRASEKPAAARPPEAAALEAELKQRGPEHVARFQQLYAEWLNRDADAAIGYLRALPTGSTRTQALLQTLMTLSSDGDRAVALARELVRARDEVFVYSPLFDRFAREDIEKAKARLAAVPAGEAREHAIRAMMFVWMQSNATGALDWAKQLADRRDRELAVEAALQGLAPREPQRALELARDLLSGAARDRAMSHAIDTLAATDPVAASKLVPLIPPGDPQMNAACNVARALAARNVQNALAWVKTLSVDLTQWMALITVLQHWAQSDPFAAAGYVMELPPGTMLDFVAPQFAPMLLNNPQDAIHWAEALPSPSAREASLVMIATTWAQRAAPEAVRWAAALKDEPLRTNATTGAFTQWMQQDPQAASAWLAKADFPRATKSLMARSHLIEP